MAIHQFDGPFTKGNEAIHNFAKNGGAFFRPAEIWTLPPGGAVMGPGDDSPLAGKEPRGLGRDRPCGALTAGEEAVLISAYAPGFASGPPSPGNVPGGYILAPFPIPSSPGGSGPGKTPPKENPPACIFDPIPCRPVEEVPTNPPTDIAPIPLEGALFYTVIGIVILLGWATVVTLQTTEAEKKAMGWPA